jgi:hypothetical protein
MKTSTRRCDSHKSTKFEAAVFLGDPNDNKNTLDRKQKFIYDAVI